MRYALLLLLPLMACQPDPYYADGELLVDEGVALAGDVFMLSPHRDAVVRVDPRTREWEALPVARDPELLERPPGADYLFTLSPRDGTLSRIAANGEVQEVELGAPYDRLAWSPDGRWGVALLGPDAEANADFEGSLNPNQFAVFSVEDLTVQLHTLNYRPLALVFTPDSSRALVSTSARLYVIDVAAGERHSVPFSIDSANPSTPALVVPGPDSQRVLVTVNDSSDLFVISLDPLFIENVVGLIGYARDIAWSPSGDRAIVANGSQYVSFLDLETFEADVLTLPHSVTTIQQSTRPEDPFALLYSPQSAHGWITRVSLGDANVLPDDPESHQLDAPVVSVVLEPEWENSAVIFHQGGGSISDLGTYDFQPSQSLSLWSLDQRAPNRILLDAAAYDFEFLPAGMAGANAQVVVALRDSARLVRYDLVNYASTVLNTYDEPTSIGLVGDGDDALLFTVHELEAGLVSFSEPGAVHEPPGGFPAAAGMALSGLADGRWITMTLRWMFALLLLTAATAQAQEEDTAPAAEPAAADEVAAEPAAEEPAAEESTDESVEEAAAAEPAAEESTEESADESVAQELAEEPVVSDEPATQEVPVADETAPVDAAGEPPPEPEPEQDEPVEPDGYVEVGPGWLPTMPAYIAVWASGNRLQMPDAAWRVLGDGKDITNMRWGVDVYIIPQLAASVALSTWEGRNGEEFSGVEADMDYFDFESRVGSVEAAAKVVLAPAYLPLRPFARVGGGAWLVSLDASGYSGSRVNRREYRGAAGFLSLTAGLEVTSPRQIRHRRIRLGGGFFVEGGVNLGAGGSHPGAVGVSLGDLGTLDLGPGVFRAGALLLF